MKWQDFPTIKLLIEAAQKLKIQTETVGKDGFVKFSRGKKSAFVYRTKMPLNNHVSVIISESKCLTSKILHSAGIPTQRYYFCLSTVSAQKRAKKLGFPLVVKPNSGSEGQGVTANITLPSELLTAIKLAYKFYPSLAISKFFPGEDYRLLVLKNKVIGAIKREPPFIKGDGKKTIRELIKAENNKRETTLRKIKIDHEVKRCLKKTKKTLNDILSRGEKLVLRQNANWSTGGSVKTLNLNFFHPSILDSARSASSLLNLQLAGVDFILKDPEKSLENNGIVLEINANPGIGVFHRPNAGRPQKVAPLILKALLSP